MLVMSAIVMNKMILLPMKIVQLLCETVLNYLKYNKLTDNDEIMFLIY